MSTYFLAPALVQLRDEVNREFPNRDTSSDGWIGDPSHAARVSDHNPCWSCSGRLNGVVRAIDIDIDDRTSRDLRRMVLNATIGDPRVWYVISNGIIYSSTYGFAARKYTGTNGHYAHVHVSLKHGVGEFNTSTWFAPQPPKIKMLPVSLSKVRAQFIAARDGKKVEFNNGVGRIQQVLNRQYGEKLGVDGLVGKATLEAWARYENSVDGQGGTRIPDFKSIVPLSKGRFRVVD